MGFAAHLTLFLFFVPSSLFLFAFCSLCRPFLRIPHSIHNSVSLCLTLPSVFAFQSIPFMDSDTRSTGKFDWLRTKQKMSSAHTSGWPCSRIMTRWRRLHSLWSGAHSKYILSYKTEAYSRTLSNRILTRHPQRISKRIVCWSPPTIKSFLTIP